jgi:class 3 adenylate cyclase/uncharacterized membrane protein affecting hemolysin expression
MTVQQSEVYSVPERGIRGAGVWLLTLYGGAVLAGLLVMLLLAVLRIDKVIDHVVDAWGEAAVQQVVQTVLDPVMEGDAIALQAHAGRFAKAPGVVSVSVYDIQNSLLAEAGESPSEYRQRASIHSFPAVLSLGDNAVGRVVLVMDAARIERLQQEVFRILGAGCIVSLILVLLASRWVSTKVKELHGQLSRVFLQFMPTEVKSADMQTAEYVSKSQFEGALVSLGAYLEDLQRPAPAKLLEAAAELMSPAEACAYVMVDVRNLDTLQRQVSRDRLREILDVFLQNVEHAARLYAARRMPVAGASIKFTFPAHGDPAYASLHALNFAYVLTGLLRACTDPEWGVTLQWTVTVDWHEANENELLRNLQRQQDEQQGHWLGEQLGLGQLACSLKLAEQLSNQDSRFGLVATTGTGGKVFYRMGQLSDSLRRMLDRQIEQLIQI